MKRVTEMLKFHPIQDKDVQKEFCAECRIQFMPEAMAYSAYEDDTFIGVAQFDIKSEGGVLYNVTLLPEIDDWEARFILGRSVMNFVDLCGMQDMYCEDSDEKFCRMLGFHKNDEGKYYLDMTGFFTSSCEHADKAPVK